MELHYSTIFEAHADRLRGRLAIKQGDTRRSWADFEARAARFAAALLAHGVKQGSRIGQLLYNSPELLETYHGSLKIRSVPFNINYRYTAEEVLYILNDAEAEALVFHSSLSGVVAAVLPHAPSIRLAVSVDDGGGRLDGAVDMLELLQAHPPARRIGRSPDDPVMIYTGGTTGMPKGVVAPLGPQLRQIVQRTPDLAALKAPADPADLMPLAETLHEQGRQFIGLPLPPMVHGAALNIIGLPALVRGGTVVLPVQRHFDPAEAWDLVQNERVTSMVIVGDAFARPLLTELERGQSRDISTLRTISSAGAVFSADVKAGLLAHMRADAAIYEYISATEGAMGVSVSTRDHSVETGRFMPHPGVILVDEQNRPLASDSGQSGRIAVPSVAHGYLKDDQKTAATFPVIDGQRYAVPGDYAVMLPDGSFRLLGRGSTCINTGGLKVFPDEVEEVLKSIPAVRDAIVIGIPDERFGQTVAALVALVSGAQTSVEEIVASTRQRLAGFKAPRIVRLVEDIPRNNVGKPDYPAVRQILGR
ncbi:MAG: AMP-binding protein [Hyphomonadaceae bacterium]